MPKHKRKERAEKDRKNPPKKKKMKHSPVVPMSKDRLFDNQDAWLDDEPGVRKW